MKLGNFLLLSLSGAGANRFFRRNRRQILARLENSRPRRARNPSSAPAPKSDVYSSLQSVDAVPYVQANKRYPFIKVNMYRVPGEAGADDPNRVERRRNAVGITNASAACFGIKAGASIPTYRRSGNIFPPRIGTKKVTSRRPTSIRWCWDTIPKWSSAPKRPSATTNCWNRSGRAT
jgi:hypothetical protein